MEIASPQNSALTRPEQQNSPSPEKNQTLRKACADFEALLTQQMLATMRESSAETEGLFEKSHGEKLFQSMLDQELAEKMAGGSGTGLGKMLFEQLSKGGSRQGDLS